MQPRDFFDQLVAIASAGDANSVARLPGAGDHAQVSQIAGVHQQALLDYCVSLPQAERALFIKGVALYENTVGGLGSVTSLKRLLPLLDEAQSSVIDWILGNTRSYWWYAHGATSIAEYEAIERSRKEGARESRRREKESVLRAKEHKARVATAHLYNAVRRGDVKAVRALLAAGANPQTTAPDGTTLVSIALSKQREDIATELQASQVEGHDPVHRRVGQ